MTDTNNYDKSAVAQIVESGGNFLNDVKNPLFVIVIMLMLFIALVIYEGITLGDRLVIALQEIKSSVDKNNDLVTQSNSLTQKLIDLEQLFNYNKKR